MTLAERRRSFHGPVVGARSATERRSGPRVVENPHRIASALLAGVALVALAAGAALWSAAVHGRWLALSAATVAITFFVLAARGHFRVRMIPDTTSRVPLIAAATAIGVGMSVALAATGLFAYPAPSALVGLLLTLGFAALLAQAVGTEILRWNWKQGRLRASAVVLGSDELARELAVEIGLRKEYGVDVVGFVAGAGQLDNTMPAPVFDSGADLGPVFEWTGADRLIIGPATPDGDRDAIRAARWASSRGVPVFVVPRFYEMGLGMDSMTPDRARGYPLVRLQRAAHPQLSRKMKRVFDVAVSLGLLAAFSPMMVAAAAAVKLTSPGPMLFAQRRVGQHGRLFTVHKFRSMTESSTSDSEWTADARVTRVGAFLRRSNIDELPQLWAIVRGDMSLVGPRPERPVFAERFTNEIPDYYARHRMPVGLTGLSQIVGLRGDTSIAERVKYDNLYIDQWSFGADVQILLKTLVAIARQHSLASKANELRSALSHDESAVPSNANASRAA